MRLIFLLICSRKNIVTLLIYKLIYMLYRARKVLVLICIKIKLLQKQGSLSKEDREVLLLLAKSLHEFSNSIKIIMGGAK